MHYLITGGTGFIGTHVIRSIPQSDTITVLSRRPQRAPSRCRVIQSLQAIRDDDVIDVVINLAGSPIDRRWTPSVRQDLMDSRLHTTHALIELMKRLVQRPRVMLSASAIGYYGACHDDITAVLDEHTPPQPSFTHALCHAWEQAAQQATSYGVRVCILRLGVVLGPGGGFIQTVSLPFKLGLGSNLGTGQQIFSWIHVDDVVQGMHHLIRHTQSSGSYNFVAPEVITYQQVTRELGRVLKRPVLLSISARWVQWLWGEMGETLLLKGSAVHPGRLLQAGYRFQYSAIQDALSDIFR